MHGLCAMCAELNESPQRRIRNYLGTVQCGCLIMGYTSLFFLWMSVESILHLRTFGKADLYCVVVQLRHVLIDDDSTIKLIICCIHGLAGSLKCVLLDLDHRFIDIYGTIGEIIGLEGVWSVMTSHPSISIRKSGCSLT